MPFSRRPRSVSQHQELEPYCYSGFVVEVIGKWFWVTAAHNLHNIEQLHDRSQLGPGRFIFMANGQKSSVPVGIYSQKWIDWTLEADKVIKSTNEELSCTRSELLDVATVFLDDYLVCQLEGSGVRPLKADQLRAPNSFGEEMYSPPFVVGFPSCTKRGNGSRSTWDMMCMMLGPL